MNKLSFSWITALTCALIGGCGPETDTQPTPTPKPEPAPQSAPAVTAPAPSRTTAPPRQRDARSTATSSSPTAPAAGAPPIVFEPPELDFGLLAPGTKARGLVTMRNDSDRDVRIRISKTSCGCAATTPLGGRVIPAGTTLSFEASMKLKSGLGPKRERLTIVFDGFAQPIVEYYLKAEASLPVRAVPPYLTAIEQLTGRVDLEARDGEPFTVLTAGGAPPRFVDFDPAVDAPRARYTLEWDLTGAERAGRVPWFWVVETDRADSRIVDLRVRHPRTRLTQPRGRPWVPKAQRAVIGTVTPGAPVEFEVYVDYVEGIEIPVHTAAVAGSTPGMTVALARAWTDGQSLWFRVRVTVDDMPPGPLYEVITLRASGFEEPLRVIGRVGS